MLDKTFPKSKAPSNSNQKSFFSDNRSGIVQRKSIFQKQKRKPFFKKSNNTGLPDNLKSGIENLSGHSMDDVQVHYNSSQPAQLQAQAYARGTDIHIASGKEEHLPHEAWHVAQQKQGRVKPTKQLKSKVNINDDAGLEKEADIMGTKAMQFKGASTSNLPESSNNLISPVVQRNIESAISEYKTVDAEKLQSLSNAQLRQFIEGLFHQKEIGVEIAKEWFELAEAESKTRKNDKYNYTLVDHWMYMHTDINEVIQWNKGITSSKEKKMNPWAKAKYGTTRHIDQAKLNRPNNLQHALILAMLKSTIYKAAPEDTMDSFQKTGMVIASEVEEKYSREGAQSQYDRSDKSYYVARDRESADNYVKSSAYGKDLKLVTARMNPKVLDKVKPDENTLGQYQNPNKTFGIEARRVAWKVEKENTYENVNLPPGLVTTEDKDNSGKLVSIIDNLLKISKKEVSIDKAVEELKKPEVGELIEYVDPDLSRLLKGNEGT